MITKVISLKDYRQKITSLWKESQSKNVRYIVMYHSRPILDVKPFVGEELVFDDKNMDREQQDYYRTLEQNMGFWMDERDDNIFVS